MYNQLPESLPNFGTARPGMRLSGSSSASPPASTRSTLCCGDTGALAKRDASRHPDVPPVCGQTITYVDFPHRSAPDTEMGCQDSLIENMITSYYYVVERMFIQMTKICLLSRLWQLRGRHSFDHATTFDFAIWESTANSLDV